MEPHAEGGRRRKCGAHGRQKNKPCEHPAGFRTDHPGVGRCWLHGGAKKVKHGRYSAVVRAIAKEQHLELYEEIRAEQEMESLRDETALLRTMLAVLPEMFPKGYGDKPQQAMAATQLVEAIGRTVSRHTQIQQAQSLIVTSRELGNLIDVIGRVLLRNVPNRDLLDRIVGDLRQEIARQLGRPGLILPEDSVAV